MNFSSCRNYWGGKTICLPPQYFHWWGDCPPCPPRIDASVNRASSNTTTSYLIEICEAEAYSWGWHPRNFPERNPDFISHERDISKSLYIFGEGMTTNIQSADFHLKRVLRNLCEGEKKNYSNVGDIVEFVSNQLNGSGRLHGYIWMYAKCISHGI